MIYDKSEIPFKGVKLEIYSYIDGEEEVVFKPNEENDSESVFEKDFNYERIRLTEIENKKVTYPYGLRNIIMYNNNLYFVGAEGIEYDGEHTYKYKLILTKINPDDIEKNTKRLSVEWKDDKGNKINSPIKKLELSVFSTNKQPYFTMHSLGPGVFRKSVYSWDRKITIGENDNWTKSIILESIGILDDPYDHKWKSLHSKEIEGFNGRFIWPTALFNEDKLYYSIHNFGEDYYFLRNYFDKENYTTKLTFYKLPEYYSYFRLKDEKNNKIKVINDISEYKELDFTEDDTTFFSKNIVKGFQIEDKLATPNEGKPVLIPIKNFEKVTLNKYKVNKTTDVYEYGYYNDTYNETYKDTYGLHYGIKKVNTIEKNEVIYGKEIDGYISYVKNNENYLIKKSDVTRVNENNVNEVKKESGKWVLVDKKYERFYVNNKPLTGLNKIGNTIYLFDKNGNKQYGWHVLNGIEMYFSPNHGGGMITGMRTIGKTTYLLTADGKKYGWHVLNGKAFYFSPQHGGSRITGKRKIGNTTYLLTSEGKKTGWHVLNGKKYYFSPEHGGGMITGKRKVGRGTYLFKSPEGYVVKQY